MAGQVTISISTHYSTMILYPQILWLPVNENTQNKAYCKYHLNFETMLLDNIHI